MRFSSRLFASVILVLCFGILLVGCADPNAGSNSTSGNSEVFNMADGSTSDASIYPDGELWSIPEQDYLTPDQWNTPEHQDALKALLPK